MLQLALQLSDRAIRDDRLVHVLALPARRAPVVETRLIVGIEVGGPHPSSQMKGDARHAKGAFRRVAGDDLPDFIRELRRHALVGVEREDPVVRRDGGGVVLLIHIAWPRAAHTRTPLPVAIATVSSLLPESTTRIRRPSGAVDGRGDVPRLVERDDGDRDRHTRILTRLPQIAKRSREAPIVTAMVLSERNFLNGLDVDLRSDVVEDGAQLVVPGDGQVALRLEDQEVGRGAGGELTLLRLEARSANSREARVVCTRCWFDCSSRAAWRTSVATCSSWLFSRTSSLRLLKPRAREARLLPRWCRAGS